ncbi:hypothetical protein XOCgx_3961 [Xanthomonas oryzae pv. oryzicola]|nr:hypothetical protein XOCgx_3961 [Xanthomonas oryzae pv. oryzicola]
MVDCCDQSGAVRCVSSTIAIHPLRCIAVRSATAASGSHAHMACAVLPLARQDAYDR